MKKIFTVGVLCSVFLFSVYVYAEDQRYTLPPYKTKISGIKYQKLRFKTTPLVLKAQEALNKKDFSAAYDIYEEVLTLDPDNYEIKESLIYVCLSLGKCNQADNYISEILEINSTYVPVLLQKAFLHKQKKQNEEALKAFLAVYKLMPETDTQRNTVLKEIVYAAQRVGNDEIVTEYAAKIEKYSGDVDFVLIKSLLKQKKHEVAFEKIEEFFKREQRKGAKKDILGYVLSLSLENNDFAWGIAFLRRISDYFYDFDTVLNFLYGLRKEEAYDAFLEVVSFMQNIGTDAERKSDVLIYEKAQVLRILGKNQDYLTEMKSLSDVSGSVVFLKEYADKLFQDGRYEEAYALVEKIIGQTKDKKVKYEQFITLAMILMQQHKTEEADLKLKEALKYGEADLNWKLSAANIAYVRGFYQECIDILSAISEGDITDREKIALAYCYYKNMMYGISLYYLKQVESVGMLSQSELYDLYMNTFYIKFSYGLYEDILKKLPEADIIKRKYSNDILRLKSFTREGEYKNALEVAKYMLDKYPLSVSEKNEIFVEIARSLSVLAKDDLYMPLKEYSALVNEEYNDKMELKNSKDAKGYRLNRYAAVIDLYTKVLGTDPDRSDIFYERSMAYKQLDELLLAEKDLYRLFEINKNPPVMAYGDMASIYTSLGKDKEAIWCFEKYLKFYNYSLDSLSDAGYTLMRLVDNNYAMCLFSHAVDIYNRINPLLEDETKKKEYLNKAHNLRKELSSLDKKIGVYPFVEINDFVFENEKKTVVKGLPSQAGIELSYRPPVIGFRDYRILEVYAGMSTRLERLSLKAEKEYTQGVFGIRYKPFKPLNFNIAGEKHYKIGEYSRDDYLLRIMFSDETNKDRHVFSPKKVFVNYSLYGEVGKFARNERESYGYVDFSIGPAKVFKGSGFLLTVPRFRIKRRWQDDNAPSTAKYTMMGLGFSVRLYEKEKEYFTQRWYVDAYMEYMKGKFDDSPFDDDEFSGIVIGVQFLR